MENGKWKMEGYRYNNNKVDNTSMDDKACFKSTSSRSAATIIINRAHKVMRCCSCPRRWCRFEWLLVLVFLTSAAYANTDRPHALTAKIKPSYEENENSNEEIISSSPSAAAISGGLSIINLLTHSAGPIFRSSARLAQLAICCYVAKASWSVMKEVWEELSAELSSSRGRGGLDLREEQDMPYADEDALSDDASFDENDNCESPGQWWQNINNRSSEKILTPKTAATRELAARLRSAGIPYASEAFSEETNADQPTVESIVKSLTRAEGNVLTQTLLTPLDVGLFEREKQQFADSAAAEATQAWNNIGGLSDAKESLLDLAFPFLEKNVGYYGGLLANPPGVLLYGPPGCGKTMLVRALAATVGARFLTVSPSCLMRKYVGETNLNVRALFSLARKISPCVIFVDELDGLFRERGGEDHDVGRDLKIEFLQLWDGIRHNQFSDSSSPVLVIGATNRPFDVDPAFLRRMPRRVFVGLPDHDARVAILKRMLKNVPLEDSFDVNTVAQKTGGYSPSDIREVLQAAALFPLREARASMMSTSNVRNGVEGVDNETPSRMQIPPLRSLTNDDILRALAVARPTHFSRKYQRQLMEYVRESNGIRDLSSSVTSFDAPSEDYFVADEGCSNSNYREEQQSSDDSSAYDDDSDIDPDL